MKAASCSKTIVLVCIILLIVFPYGTISSDKGNNGRAPMRNGGSARNDEEMKGLGKPIQQRQIPTKAAFFKLRQEREQLYEAYNLLHSLAQASIQIVPLNS